MKKYLLILACVFVALAANAGGGRATKHLVNPLDFELWTSRVINYDVVIDNGYGTVQPNGGKPRRPTDPAKPTGGNLDGFIINMSGQLGDPSLTTDEVNALVDQVLDACPADGNSIADAITLIELLYDIED